MVADPNGQEPRPIAFFEQHDAVAIEQAIENGVDLDALHRQFLFTVVRLDYSIRPEKAAMEAEVRLGLPGVATPRPRAPALAVASEKAIITALCSCDKAQTLCNGAW